MNKIRLVGTHVYLDEHDISAYVVSIEKVSDEAIAVILHGDVIDQRKAEKPKRIKVKEESKEVEDGDG